MNLPARQLRKSSTDAEKCLWDKLRRTQIAGHRFRRQHPLGPYVVDFICLEQKLIVEVDGGQHGSAVEQEKDSTRTHWLAERGYRVIRFWNNDILQNCEGVIIAIQAALDVE